MELRSRCRSLQGCAYTYMYHACGEGMATFVGWSTLLRHLAITAALARCFSQNLDLSLDHQIHNFMSKHVGSLPLIGCTPDFIAPVVVLAMASLFCVGVMCKKFWMNLMNCVVMLLLIFSLVVGLFQVDFTHWSSTEIFFSNGAFGVGQNHL